MKLLYHVLPLLGTIVLASDVLPPLSTVELASELTLNATQCQCPQLKCPGDDPVASTSLPC
jgi:hypothetical protein